MRWSSLAWSASRWSSSAERRSRSCLRADEGLGTVLDPLDFLVQPLLAVGQPQFAALEVAAQLAYLVLDFADLFFDFAAALGGLFGLLAGSGRGCRLPRTRRGRGCARLPGRAGRGPVSWAFAGARAGMFAVRRHTTTSANTTASNPITMNASDNPLLTVTPFRP